MMPVPQGTSGRSGNRLYSVVQNGFGLFPVRAHHHFMTFGINDQRAANAFPVFPGPFGNRSNVAGCSKPNGEFFGHLHEGLPPGIAIGIFFVIMVWWYGPAGGGKDNVGTHVTEGPRQHMVPGIGICTDKQSHGSPGGGAYIQPVALCINIVGYIQLVELTVLYQQLPLVVNDHAVL